MIKFFRHIRKSLIEQNQMGKYFKYAIGEILLVVIGILIALQVNNWNETRKRQIELDKLLNDIEQDLIANYHQANGALRFYKKQDSIAKLIAAKDLTAKDYRDNYNLNYYAGNWDYYVPSDKNLNQFVDAEKIIALKYKPVLESAKTLQLYKTVLDDTWSNLEQNIDENVNSLSSWPWFVKNDSVSSANRLDYMLHNPEYEIMALRYWIMIQNYYDKVSRYRAQSMATLATIKQISSNYSTEQIEVLFQGLGMPPYMEYDCNIPSSELKHQRDMRSSALYGNLTANEIRLYVTNNEGRKVNDFYLSPYQFKTIPGSEYFGIDGDNNILVQYLGENDECIKKYGVPENGYLIIK
ncbi:DUF6090 family protein [Winogradskyella alexanderae]|uniref:Uncharacterized protein n=1 Tax=Winogradskyella alexanderae TaxID=2877123 RepID=A0ABS7XUU9_9FLAO|nr:DUF6090 family protein [Winogradskyella alexanderae]MCA0133804.1 hypothetical protein [Winogradskyella alexanderae]